jgi:hypothetical protein
MADCEVATKFSRIDPNDQWKGDAIIDFAPWVFWPHSKEELRRSIQTRIFAGCRATTSVVKKAIQATMEQETLVSKTRSAKIPWELPASSRPPVTRDFFLLLLET